MTTPRYPGELGVPPAPRPVTTASFVICGDGVIINAPQSGLPIRLDPLSNWAGDPTDIPRPK